MNYKNSKSDSGSYINGVYTTKNGYSNSGLNCPKGVRLYNNEIKQAIFFEPEDTANGEYFKRITQEVAPDILPYYAISNYGRILNTRSGKIIKPNYRPNGYEYVCLAADNSKTGQKKYSTHRLVLKTFDPRDDMDSLQVNHIHGDKTQNYINKVMPDGSLDTGIEWSTASENSKHREETGLTKHYKLNFEEATKIRNLRNLGYSYKYIAEEIYNNEISSVNVQNICLNKIYFDPNYTPIPFNELLQLNPSKIHRLTDIDAENIKKLYSDGYKYEEIQSKFFPDFSIAAISDIIREKTHNSTRG